MTLNDLPTLNATLNAACTVLLLAGWICIKTGRKIAHVGFMICALVVSAAFLVGYVIHHVHAGHVPFNGKGWIRWIYLPMLFTHVVLAASCVVLVPMTVIRAARGKLERHKAIARWTFPIWLYVSVTGVLVYLMCYIWFA